MNGRILLIAGGLLLLAALGTGGYALMNIAEQFIAKREGFSATPYKDSAGILTIGYGHKILPGEHFTQVTQAEALALLKSDMAKATAAVNQFVRVPLNQNQHAALVSFAFNVGVNAFESSTLLRLVNQGKYSEAAAQFPLWDHIHVNGQLVQSAGLLNRRNAEASLFNTPSTIMVA